MRFDGRRILVTGGTAGIGRAGALRIVREGGQVVVTGSSQERVEQFRGGPGITAVCNDAAAPDTGERLARELGNQCFDGIWLNAGIARVAAVDEVDAALFDRMMAVNARGPMLQLAALAERIERGGSVVLTASTAAYRGDAFAALYAATKGALIALCRAWAAAFAPRNIRVNVVVPGSIATEFRNFMSDEVRDEFESGVVDAVPLARMGLPEEVAAVALFLLSDDASYVTGSQYLVDGGLIRL
jgi:NAD(P)-dependent dehydrogenase (short-subunit alcohol dehydrogenase family)